jgi:glycerate dehydrogenase
MKVLAYDKTRSPEGALLAEYVELDALLAASDVVSLHCPLFPDTQGIINQASLAKMKDGAILLNTSRGPLVVEADVKAALDGGKLAYYAADVASAEPIAQDNPLLGSKNCILTPHIAWAPLESRARLMDVSVGNLRCFLDGRPQNVVNK